MRFLFADIVVDSEQVVLTKHAKKINCEPRVFELLIYFCNHPKEAITRERLVAQVWQGRIVSDAAVNRAVSELRKIIEDDPSTPLLIKTVSKIGYILTVVPTLSETQPINENNFLTQKKLEHLDTIAPNFQSTKIRYGIWLVFLTIISLFIIFSDYIKTTHKNSEVLGVLERKPITSTMGSAFNPFFHAETNTLLFLYRNNANAYAQVYIQKEQNAIEAISHDDYYYTDVITGNDGLIYASRLNNLQQRHCEIVKIDLITKRVSTVLSCGQGVVTQLAFDEIKRRLIYQSRSSISEPYAIHSFQIDTGRKQQLSHPIQVGNNTGDYAFSISPNNQTLAIIEYNSNNVDTIKLLDLSNNHLIESAPFINNVYGLIWHSNDQILASNSDGLYDLNTKNLTFKITEHSDQYGRLALGSDKKSILTERSQTTVNIFKYSKNQTTITPLTASRGINLSPVFGNKSNILAFKSNKTGKNEIYIQQEQQPDFMTRFANNIEYINGMSWSPNDDKLVASINNKLYLYALESKSWQPLAKEFTQVHHVAFVKESVMFSAEVDGQWNIWQLSLTDGIIKQITTKGGYSVQGSADMVYFTKFNHQGLYQINLTTNIESTLIEAFPVSGWRHWQLRDDKIYYLLDKTLKELNLSTKSKKAIHTFTGRKPNTCNVSYQHEFFACEHVEFTTSNIWQLQLDKTIKN